MSAAETYREFQAMHPERPERFVPTVPNMRRWHWHIKEAQEREAFLTWQNIQSGAGKELANARRVKDFEGFGHMKKNWLDLADLFPGRQVWATGSRVSGEWIEVWSGASIRRMRAAIGKADKPESDWDIWLQPLPEDEFMDLRMRLPYWADLLTFRVPDDEKIAIPMWTFDKLPASEHDNAIALFEAQDWGGLVRLHDKYGLSQNSYCCDPTPAINWFKWAIENDKIKKTAAQAATVRVAANGG